MNITALAKTLKENEGYLIVSPENARYFTAFDSSNAWIFVTARKSVYMTDSRYIEAAGKNVDGCDEIVEMKSGGEQLKELAAAAGINTLYIESSRMTLDTFERLQKQLDGVCALVGGNTLDKAVDGIRSVKSDGEVEKILAAQKIAEKAFDEILDFIRVGVTEKEIALKLDFLMLSGGADAVSFETIAVSGKNSSMPHGVPCNKKIENGDFITMDFGAVVDGYHSDMTRTVAVGNVSDEQKEIYGIVLAAQEAALASLKAGVDCAAADAAARDIIAANGYGAFFGHGTGHGVGVEIHEGPSLSPRSKSVLQAGNVVTVEPGIYLPDKFGVRIEDMALITATGHKNLTASPKSLIII